MRLPSPSRPGWRPTVAEVPSFASYVADHPRPRLGWDDETLAIAAGCYVFAYRLGAPAGDLAQRLAREWAAAHPDDLAPEGPDAP